MDGRVIHLHVAEKFYTSQFISICKCEIKRMKRFGSLYKIIAKILANRLVGVLGDLVNELWVVVEVGWLNNAASKLGVLSLRLHSLSWVRKLGEFCQEASLKEVGSSVYSLIKAIYGEDGILKQGCFGWIQNLLDIDSLRSRVLNVGINVADYIRLKTGGRGEHAVMGRQLVWNGDDVHQRAVPTKARSGIEEMQLNSLAEISRMTTLVPCEGSLRLDVRKSMGYFQ
ncbi:hypothetical protein Tco_1476789 [Tanacetum coccineum]